MADTTWWREEHIGFIEQKAGEILSGKPELALRNVRPSTPADNGPREYKVIIDNVKTRHVVIANVNFITFSNLFDPGDLAGAERLVQQAIDSALAASAGSHDESAV